MADGSTVVWKGGTEHWTRKGDVKLFLWSKKAAAGTKHGTILFVHGSSMASQPTFDLTVPGRADSSAMDYFASLGYDTWTMDNEGYGRSDKNRPQNNDISNGADDLAVGSQYILEKTGAKKLLVYGISSGALKAALFAQRHPDRVARIALDAFVWTGDGSPTLEERKKKLPQFINVNRRPIDRKFVQSIFERDHPGTADDATIRAFADAILALDDSVPTGTYVDMYARSCRSSIRRGSPCPRSSCAASSMESPASTTWSSSSSAFPTPTNSSR
jgi:pimeloyl-ACP methyl ester carboxylesterase